MGSAYYYGSMKRFVTKKAAPATEAVSQYTNQAAPTTEAYVPPTNSVMPQSNSIMPQSGSYTPQPIMKSGNYTPQSTTTNPAATGKKKLSKGAKVGIGLGVAALVGTGAYLMFRKKDSTPAKRKSSPRKTSNKEDLGSIKLQ